MRRILFISCLLLAAACGRRPDAASIIDSYVAEFNAADEECYANSFPNSEAAAFLKTYVPVFECPDKELERTWWFRWWTFRKHVKEVPDGYVITEFLPEVGWAGKYNAICCAGPHHFREGRWLRDTTFMQSYMRYWFSDGANPRGYSFPVANALLDYNAVHPCPQLIESLYPELKANYAEWERTHRDANGLFWQGDGYDGMEVSISGALDPQTQGYRATINSYMIADARALAAMALILDDSDEAALYSAKADTLAALMDSLLWDEQARFYKVLPRNAGDGTLSPARELHGYVPWVYGIPDADKTDAWLQLADTMGFKAPFGPTTAERRAEGFAVAYEGHECQWNGPGWPFATAQTLTGLANSLHRDGETALTKKDYFELLQTYSNSHRMHLDDGTEVCWIDENLNPFTGEWLARKMMLDNGAPIHERGKDYNHSTFCDLIISGLIGLEPIGDGGFSVEPLIPEGLWDWFYLGGISIAGSDVEIVWDKSGRRYGLGRGFSVFRDGRRIFHSDTYSTRFVLASTQEPGKEKLGLDLTVVTSNVRYNEPEDGINRWDNRKDALVAEILSADPDIIGTQECLHYQRQYMKRALKGYKTVGVAREDGKKDGEYSAIFYRKSRFRAVECGNFWLSETPDVPSIGWDAACIRIATWAFLEEKSTGKRFFFVNTHLDHVGGVARREGVNLLCRKAKEIGGDCPMVITGDFNSWRNDEVIMHVKNSGILHTFDIAKEKKTGIASYHGFGGLESMAKVVPEDQRPALLDYIFISEGSCSYYEIMPEKSPDGRFVSDHCPVMAKVTL